MGASGNVYDFDVNQTLSDVARDDTVKAVVLRIDSPGGSVIASDNIWHAVRALAKKKPVVASFGDVAASGGYYIASAATEVYSIPATITGSIGVVGGKMVFSGAADKLGVHSERIQTGKNAGLESPFSKFSDTERSAVMHTMQSAYDMFIDRVVEGRGLKRDKVLEVAEGRVWTGTQALSFGLVTKMGSLDDATSRARELAKVAAGTPAEIVPKPKNLMDFINEAFGQPQASIAGKVISRLPAAELALSVASMFVDEHVLAVSPVFVQVR
jgi:protease-4